MIESVESLREQLEDAMDDLHDFEDNVPGRLAWARLRKASPNHPILISRLALLFSALVSFGVAFSIFLIPFIESHLTTAQRRSLPISAIKSLETAMNLPLPVAFGGISLGLFFAWVMLGFAGTSLGRDKEMLPHEKLTHTKLLAEVKNITRELNTLEQEEKENARRNAAAPVLHRPNDGAVAFDDGDSFVVYDDSPAVGYVEDDTAPGYEDEGSTLTELGFGKKISTVFPDFAVDEPWLKAVILRTMELAESYPLQARLEYNQESGLPVTLILERVTPAMGIRAMLAYVECIVEIPCPPKARIEFPNASSVERSFVRSLMDALTPHFPNAEVLRDGNAVDIIFPGPDRRWEHYPTIPTY